MAANIEIITYNGKTVIPRTDGILQDASIGRNGIFYGCEVTASGNVINVEGGYGIIKGRYFEIMQSTIPITLATTDSLNGRLYVRLDLSNTESPIQLLTVTGTTLPSLEQDDDANFIDGVWEMEMATFTVTTTEVTNVVTKFSTIVDNGTAYDTLNGFIDDFYFIASSSSTSNNNIKYRGSNIYTSSSDYRYIVFAVTFDGSVGIWGVNTSGDGAVKEFGSNGKGMSVFFSTATHALCLRVTNATSMSYKIIRVK